jgi:RND family efflux transporter MFP subunit
VGDTVSRGQIIASLDSSDLQASRDKARADLLAAKAELAKVQNGESINSEVSINKEQVINSIVSAYTKSDDAVRNKVDQFFTDGQSSGPKIKYTFYNYFDTKNKINDSRLAIGEVLNNFGVMANNLNSTSYNDKSITQAKNYVQKVKAFLDLISLAVNSFEESVDLSKTVLEKYKSDIGTARTNINSALLDLASYEDKLRSSLSDIPVLEAKVKSAEANVRNYDAQIAKTVIVAPFNGVVSLQDAKVGESVGAHTKMAGMISTDLEVEVYIPEISIPGIALGNKATVKLDAYADAIFDATITHVDPAETIRDGVSNYKVKLILLSPDARVRSGLTGDVSIETEKKQNIISVGERSVVTMDGKYYVYKKTADRSIKTEIVLGIKDGKGNVEILSGVYEDDKILLNPPLTN